MPPKPKPYEIPLWIKTAIHNITAGGKLIKRPYISTIYLGLPRLKKWRW